MIMDKSYPVKPTKIAAFIVAEVILNQDENNYRIYLDTIEKKFPALQGTGWQEDEEFMDLIFYEMRNYPQFGGGREHKFLPGIADQIYWDKYGGCGPALDCVAFTDYIAYESEEE